MERVSLGSSGITVSKFCFGTGMIARRGEWNEAAADATVARIHYALDRGCNYIDTAPSYRTEEVVGRAISGRRDQVVVATKIGHCEPSEVAPTLEASLRSLNTDYVDLYIFRWPRPSLPLESLFEELVRLREAGKIRAIGISNFNLEQTRIAASYGVVNSQPPYSILWRIPEEVVSYCRMHSVSITAYAPLAQGILTGRYTRQATEVKCGNVLLSEEVRAATLEVAALLDRVADKLGCTSSQAALAWVLQTPGIGSLIFETGSISHWQENLGSFGVHLPQADYDELDKAGFAVWNRFGPEANMWGLKIT